MPEIRQALICEDVRVEASGQVSAMGMWGADMRVPAFPTALRGMCFLVFVSNVEAITADFRMRIEGPLDGAPFEHSGKLPVEPGKTGHNINFAVVPIVVVSEGLIRATFSLLTQPIQERVVELAVFRAEV
jgi:hypothetical protein